MSYPPGVTQDSFDDDMEDLGYDPDDDTCPCCHGTGYLDNGKRCFPCYRAAQENKADDDVTEMYERGEL